MLLAEPPPSQGDLHFRVFGFSVRVHPWFWIVSLLMGISGSEPADPMGTLQWVAVVFFSILIHELGHALLQRRFGGQPRIILYGLGGLAACDDCDRSPRSQILISLAGPMAGFLLAVILLTAIRLAGHRIEFGKFPGLIGLFVPAWQPFESTLANELIFDLLYINIFWGLVNLLPIYPLDGGRVAREVFTLKESHRGIIQSLWVSVVTAGIMASFGLSRNSLFITFMFGYLAYANYQTIQAYQRHWQ